MTRRYWLFKTEPSEFGIADLAAQPDGKTRWDGIRNYQARNNLRDHTATGDGVLIYHSSCREPGVAGIAEICSDPYPDPAQFDPDSPYFDSKSTPEQPRWYSVDIRHRHTLERVVAPATLKALPGLADMVLFRQARLSVQPLSEEEWQIIVDLAGTESL